MKEWKVIKGFEDYEINNIGEVKSHKNQRAIILKKRISVDGYVWYILTKNGKGYGKRAHRLVAEAFIENPENKPTVNHIDGNKLNNNVKNLEWATRFEQMKHAYKLGLKKPMQGTLSGRHVLNEDEVREIRRIYKGHSKEFGMNALAEKYNVSSSTIDKCVRNKNYKNIK